MRMWAWMWEKRGLLKHTWTLNLTSPVWDRQAFQNQTKVFLFPTKIKCSAEDRSHWIWAYRTNKHVLLLCSSDSSIKLNTDTYPYWELAVKLSLEEQKEEILIVDVLKLYKVELIMSNLNNDHASGGISSDSLNDGSNNKYVPL